MAVMSDNMYNARIVATPYVSSNAYYGYVPPSRRENQLDVIHEHTGSRDSSTFNPYPRDTAMETDDDGYGYTMASRCLNNDCVILEASTRNRLEAKNKLQQRQQQTIQDADTVRRMNRKRCNGDLGHFRELKKFREGSGNSHVYRGPRCTKDRGLATLRNEAALLHLSTTDDKCQERPSVANKNESCCWAAGNCSLISNSNCKSLLTSNDSKLIENSREYDEILFETHGCSIYHHHRLQLLDNDCIETEF